MSALGYKAVGYIRVSTKRQADQGLSLEGQAESIRQWARRHSCDLLSIEEDDCPAHGPAGLARPGLGAAITRARAEGVPIVVTAIDRLSRDTRSLKVLGLDDIHILTTSSNRRVGKRRLRELVRAAQGEIAELSAHGQASQRSAKRTRSNLRPEDRRAGALGNLDRVDEKIQSLIEQIQKHPNLLAMSWPQRVDHLNGQNALNLLSRKPQTRKPWTTGSLRKPFKRALEEMRIQAEIDDLDIADDFYSGRQECAEGACTSDVVGLPPASTYPSSGRPGASDDEFSTPPVTDVYEQDDPTTLTSSTRLSPAESKELRVLVEKLRMDPNDLMDRLNIGAGEQSLWLSLLDSEPVSLDLAERARVLLTQTSHYGRF